MTINNTTINGNVDNRQTNVTINMYSAENIDHILDDKRRMDRYMERCYMAIPYLIRDIHFDPERPDNHTVRMPNCRDKYVEVRTQRGWESKMRNEVVNDLIQRSGDTLEEHFNSDACATLSSWTRKHFGEVIDACLEMPYDKEKRAALENEIMIVIKDGRKTCDGKLASAAQSASGFAATESSEDLRNQLQELQRTVDGLRLALARTLV